MAEHSEQSEHHIVPVKVYLAVFLALMVLTAITVAVAKFDLEHIWGPMNIIIALTVAVIKATLVVLYFMHVRYSSRLTQVIVVSGIFWLIIMLAFTISDYLTRGGWPTNLAQ